MNTALTPEQQKKWIRFGIISVVVLIIGILLMTSYSSLVKKEENVKLKWAEVENTYQRRIDLIPNLVAVVKGLSDFEQGTLEKIAAARSEAQRTLINGGNTEEDIRLQQRMQDSLAATANRVIARIEAYPELKGTEAYSGLQTQLSGTERRIKVARVDFNEAVNNYNTKLRSFPTNIFAGLFGFKKKQGFQAESGADQAVEITFKK